MENIVKDFNIIEQQILKYIFNKYINDDKYDEFINKIVRKNKQISQKDLIDDDDGDGCQYIILMNNKIRRCKFKTDNIYCHLHANKENILKDAYKIILDKMDHSE